MPTRTAPYKLEDFAREVQKLGRSAHEQVGPEDLAYTKRLMALSRAAEIAGRLTLQFFPLPGFWCLGTAALSFHLALDAQIMHAIEHGAFVGLPGALPYTPDRFETLSLPIRARTWGLAHAIHHRYPSLPGKDPDTIHALYRVHESSLWRFWHRFNTFLPQLFLFEQFAFTYDRFLKREGCRSRSDRSELLKYMAFVAYQYVLFPVMAGARWKDVLAAGLLANTIRNLVFFGLQSGSSVGREICTDHELNSGRKTPGEWCRFQVETSKNFWVSRLWRPILGGLDRHIEHHLFSSLPPRRLHAMAPKLKVLCAKHGVKYHEHPSFLATLRDSLAYLHQLSRPR